MGIAIPETEPETVDPHVAHRLAAWMQEAIEADCGVLKPSTVALRLRAAPLPSWAAVARSVGIPEPSAAMVAEARRIADVAASRGTTPAQTRTGALR